MTLAYRAAPGERTLAGSDLPLTVMAVPGTADEAPLRKLLSSVLAGDTLVFARGGTLYRLESALGRDATVAVAISMR